MQNFQVAKGHAYASDAVVILDEHGALGDPAAAAVQLCDRRAGLGADVCAHIVPLTATNSTEAFRADAPDVQWLATVYDPDGVAGAPTDTALRVAAAALVKAGLMSPDRRDVIGFAVSDGGEHADANLTVRDTLLGVASVTCDLGRWSSGADAEILPAGDNVVRPALGITLTQSYLVTAVSSAQELGSLNLMHPPRVTPEPAAYATVVFVAPNDPILKDSVGQVLVRAAHPEIGEVVPTGEAAAAAALAFRHWGGEAMPHNWRALVGLGASHEDPVAVRMFPTEAGEHVSIASPVAVPFIGTADIADPAGR